jgi:hypothetical protein
MLGKRSATVRSLFPCLHLFALPKPRTNAELIGSSICLVSIDQHDWTLVLFPSTEYIIHQRENSGADKHDDSPVEGREIDWRALGPETPEESMERVEKTGGVDRDAPAAKGPLAGWEQLGMLDAPVEDGADGDDVRDHEGYDVEGYDYNTLSRCD